MPVFPSRAGVLTATALLATCVASAQTVSLRLPERTRLLQDQRVDLVVEVRNPVNGGFLRVTAGSRDISDQFRGPFPTDLDCDGKIDTVYRADLFSFQDLGTQRIVATYSPNNATDARNVEVRQFTQAPQRRNVVLFIGDAMGTAYRDAGRLVGRSVLTAPGVSGLREGFFDRLQEMDRMPVSGMVMTYGSDRVIPDSANTATAWSTGNKTFEAALGVFADGTDCVWRPGLTAANTATALDNPRVETLWEYLKRKYNYRTGVVSTAFITDATPAGEGAHIASRTNLFEVARQYLENPMLGGQPVFDVILGGGREDFDPDIRTDRRNLVQEFQGKGYTFVSTATELGRLNSSTGRALGLFRRPNTVARATTGIRATANGNMEVAYDKLKLVRPASEPQADFGTYTDQPFLDLMTQKAIDVLSAGGAQPFILMVEGASVDKQSHPNHAAGVIWDVIELDKAVGVARTFAAARSPQDTLVLVTADHDQSMSIIGINQTADADLTNRTNGYDITLSAPVGAQRTRVLGDAYSNVRASYGYFNSGGDPNTSGREGAPGLTYQGIFDLAGFPDYNDANGDGYPENATAGTRGKTRLSVGFRTGNHTGSSVPVTAEGPGAFLFTGYMDQTDVMFKIAFALTGDTQDGDALIRTLTNAKYPATYGK